MSLDGDILRSGTFAVQFFLLAEEVEIQLSDLKLADIAVGIEGWIKLNVIFHKRVY